MPRRILACLLPLFCLLLTACTDTPSGQLTPVDVYVPPVTEVRSDAPASWTLTLDGATYTLTYRCTTASPRWPFELDVYTTRRARCRRNSAPAATGRPPSPVPIFLRLTGKRSPKPSRRNARRRGCQPAAYRLTGTRIAKPSASATGRCC